MAALHAVASHCPDLARHLLDDRGGLRRSVRVFVNGGDTRFADGLSSPLVDHDRLEVVLALAGG